MNRNLTARPRPPESGQTLFNFRPAGFVSVLLAAVVLGGCGGTGSQSFPPVATPPPQLLSAPATAVHDVTSLLQRLESAYESGDFDTIRQQFSDSRLAGTIASQMQTWDSDRAHPLHVSLVYMKMTAPNQYVGTVEFSVDPRAVPAYSIFRFSRTSAGVRIDGQETGISGHTYQSADWKVIRSAHFLVYHSPYQLLGRDAETLALLEHERTLFQQRFGVHLPPLAAYYLYPQQSMMNGMTGGACGRTAEYVGCADVYHVPPAIHTSEWPSYHEPIHVFELALVPKASKKYVWFAPLFLAEGAAVALEDRELDPRLSDYCSDLVYIPLDICAVQAASLVNAMNLLSDSGFKTGSIGNSYLIAGSFVKFLILHYGYRKFGAFYYAVAAQPSDKESDYNVAAHKVYQQTIRELIFAWRTALCTSGC
jgi:hypothetical protein